MKNFKRFIALFTVALIVMATLIPSLTAAPAGVAAKAGEAVELTYEYEAIGGINGEFTFSNPEMIENVDIIVSPEFTGWRKDYTIAYVKGEPANCRVTLKFDIAETAEVGEECEVVFEYKTTVEGEVPSAADCTTVVRVEAIDYTALIEQISRVGRLNKDDYTPESWSAMTDVYSEAIALVDHARLQSDVDDMTARLKDAIDNLVRKPAIDYTALNAQIAVAEGLTEADYTAESWSAMTAVLDRAKALVNNAETQKQVDDMTAELVAAINALVRKPTAPAIDYTALNAQIARADALREADYTAASWSAMKAVYNRAKALVNNASTQAQVNTMTAELKTAIDSLVRKPAVVAIDYTALNAQIARADALKEDEYTAESWAAMKKVYDEAKALVGKATSQAQVNTMTANLKAAIDALVKKAVPGAIDYTKLKEQIAIADALKEADYTAESWAAMKKVYDAAKALVDNAKSQTEVDQMTASLKLAIEGLVKKAVPGVIDYTKLKEQIERADKLNEKDYTKDSWAAMKKIYDEAKALIDNAKTQEEVDQMTEKLQAAIDALVKAPSYAWIWWVVIILLLIVAAVVVYLYYKKKKSK
ncbi:MAG: FIVAR domain-containing protein [Clostridia bacterium]|nr:FIVAR domain-containing protein [Clostridia bacterium]